MASLANRWLGGRTKTFVHSQQQYQTWKPCLVWEWAEGSKAPLLRFNTVVVTLGAIITKDDWVISFTTPPN
eukprot:m.510270 g.510270  ORF g.510270 m.510270 type:complete len:71 (+) comp21889_c0_seq46:391-603(+)